MAKQEIEYLVLGGMMNNEYAVSVSLNSIKSSYFTDASCRIIYQSFYNYYKKYQRLPSQLEMGQAISDNFIPLGPTKEEVVSVCDRLMSLGGQVDEKYLIDNIESFIKQYRLETSLKKAIDSYSQKGEVSLENMASGLVDSLDFSLSREGIYKMSNIDDIIRSRDDVLGNGDDDKIIKSVFPKVNLSQTYQGYIQGSLSVVVAPPGCFTGGTRIMTIDGKTHTMEELYKNKPHFGVYSMSPDDLEMAPGPADCVELAGYEDKLVEVEIDGQYKIKSTLDHPYMTREGKYVEAQNLQIGQSLMPLKRDHEPLLGDKFKNHRTGVYERITNGKNQSAFTHHLVAERFVEWPEGYTVVNHKDKNKFNNYPDNLEWMKDIRAHSKYHYEHGDYDTWIENGKKTRFTSELTRARNLKNWQNPEYAERMKRRFLDSGDAEKGNKILQSGNKNPERQESRRKMKVLSFVNSMIHKYGADNITVDNFEKLSSGMDSKYKIHLRGISEAYDCSIKNDDNRRHDDIDMNLLSSVWNQVLSDAEHYNHKVTSIKIIKLDKKVPVYGVVNASIFKNYAIALDDEGTQGVMVSNTGKTSILVNEGAYAARQGFNVLHIFLGDMVEYDGFIRYSANITGQTQEDLMKLSVDDVKNLVSTYTSKEQGEIFDRIDYKAFASSEITVERLMSFITNEETKSGKHYDMLIIDYADNFATEGDNSYSEMGDVYDKMLLFARQNHSAILTASQPKIGYWSNEIIPLEGAGDSSRKQHIVDMMLTFNKPSRNSNVGTLFLAKVRRGTTGDVVRVKLDMSRCRIVEISEEEYNKIKADELNSGQN